jgi:hypothetical protein
MPSSSCNTLTSRNTVLLLKSSGLVELSESETEYVVTAVKHIFKEHVVVQYNIKNTLPDTVLENVTVAATPEEEDVLEEDFIIPAPKLPTDEPGIVYVAFKKLGGENSVPVTSFTNNLKFTSKEIDPTTGEPEDSGYDDEYQVEDLELTGSDYVIPTFAGSFDHVWEQTGANGEEESETLQLSNMKGITGTYNFYLIFARDTNNFHRCHGTADRGPVAPTPRRHRRRPQQQHTHAQAVRQDRLRWPCRLSYQDGLLQQSRCHDQDHCPRRRGGCCRGCDCFCVLISLLYLFCCYLLNPGWGDKSVYVFHVSWLVRLRRPSLKTCQCNFSSKYHTIFMPPTPLGVSVLLS